MALIFQREKFEDLEREIFPLWERHYQELGVLKDKFPMSPDFEKYRTLSEADVLICFTGRSKGLLKAYNMFVVTPHLHYSQTLFAQNDLIYVDPQFRGKTGSRMVDWCEEELKNLGVQVVSYHVKPALDFGSGMLRRHGYTEADRIWFKYVGD